MHARQESNLEPAALETAALPIELRTLAGLLPEGRSRPIVLQRHNGNAAVQEPGADVVGPVLHLECRCARVQPGQQERRTYSAEQ